MLGSPGKSQVSSKHPAGRVRNYNGDAVYIYAFDVAYEFGKEPLRELLGQHVAQFSMDISKRAPRHLFFYRPQMVRLPRWSVSALMVRYAFNGPSSCFRLGRSVLP